VLFWTSSSDHYARHYHLIPDCSQLRKGLKRHKTGHVVMVRETGELAPCSLCVGPDFPKYYKSFCDICDTFRACPHNGGILVHSDLGNVWVWPDRVARHSPLRAG
jgi:hypothetical protein